MSTPLFLSYDTQGAKDTFPDWVSNISPDDTPFASFTGKAPIGNTFFQWQTDRLNVVADNAWSDDEDDIPEATQLTTKTYGNYTQILRKVVRVSNTAEAMDAFGRGKELDYQIQKASAELKRDLESVLLSDQVADSGDDDGARRTAGFYELTAGIDEAEPTTGAITHKKLPGTTFTEADVMDITEQLYLAGSRANTIMFHPVHAPIFNNFFENGDSRVSMYDVTDDTVPNTLTSFTDPLGMEWILIPNRSMSEFCVYFFHPHDWFQRVLRPPELTEMAIEGNFRTYMIEMEVGLQHRNPWASGILEMTYTPTVHTININPLAYTPWAGQDNATLAITSSDKPIRTEWSSSNEDVASIGNDGVISFLKEGTTTITATAYYRYQETASATLSITVAPITIARSTTSYSVVQSNDISLAGSLVLDPPEANTAGFIYKKISDDEYTTLDEKTGTVHGLLETPDDVDSRFTVTSAHDSSINITVDVSVSTTDHNIQLSNTPSKVMVDTEYTLYFTGLELATSIATTQSSDLTVSAPVQDGNNYKIVVKTGLTPTISSNLRVNGVFPDGKGSYNFTFAVNDYQVLWSEISSSDIVLPHDDIMGNSYRVNVHTNDPEGDANHKPVWSSDNEDVMTVDKEFGKPHIVHMLKEGQAILKAEIVFTPNITRSVTQVINVRKPAIQWVKMPVSDTVGRPQTIEATCDLDASKYHVVYESSDTTIATITGNTLTTKSKEGPTTITAHFHIGSEIVDSDPVTINVVKITFGIKPGTSNTVSFTVNKPTYFIPTLHFVMNPPSLFDGRCIISVAGSENSDIFTIEESQPNGIWTYKITAKRKASNSVRVVVQPYDHQSITLLQQFYFTTQFLYGADVLTTPPNALAAPLTMGDKILLKPIAPQAGQKPFASVEYTKVLDDNNRSAGTIIRNNGNTGDINDWTAYWDAASINIYDGSGNPVPPTQYPVTNTLVVTMTFNSKVTVDGKTQNETQELRIPITVKYPNT